MNTRILFLVGIAYFIINNIAYAEQGNTKVAQESLDRGAGLFEAGDYSHALVEFDQAYNITNRWEILYNIGACNEALHNYSKALHAMEQYLNQGRNSLDQSDIREVETKISQLRLMVGTININANVNGAKVLIDGNEAGVTPLENYRINFGTHRIRIEPQGYIPYEREINIRGGEQRDLDIQLSESPDVQQTQQQTAQQTQQTEQHETQTEQLTTQTEHETSHENTDEQTTERPFYKQWWFWTVIGVGVVGVGVSTALLVAQPFDSTIDSDFSFSE